MSADDVEIIEKTTPFQGYFRIDRYRLKHRLFEGGISTEMTREVFERGHAVAVILYDPDLERLVFIEQFRPGVYAALASPWFDDGFSPWLMECVAGIIEEGETPEGVARRETLEEAGCEIGEMLPICHYFASPGATSETVFVYCARTDASRAGGIHGVGAEHENIRVHVVSTEEAFAWLDAGRFINAMTLVGMQWFRHNVDAVRARWRKDP